MTDTLTHARTLAQPLAWAVAAGHCPVITSLTRPPLEAVGKLIGIHAGKLIDGDAYHGLRWGEGGLPERPEAKTLTLGALIGVARLVGVVRESREYPGQFCRLIGRGPVVEPLDMPTNERIRPWWRGSWGWLLEEAVLLPEPIPMRGQQGLWRLPDFALEHQGYMTGAEWALEQWRKAREPR